MKSLFIIYVKNQQESNKFYAHVLQTVPVLNVPGMTEFELSPDTKLGIMPEAGIAKILGTAVPHPETGNGIPRCELYLSVENPDEFYSRAINNGGKSISKTELRDWGDEVCYCTDLDGHILAFAKKKDLPE
ncbi:MAG: VOC family protein [Ignavibacteriae bacterium]|nr:MAG: VOC family protein [Ignavibacteriota bacterium]